MSPGAAFHCEVCGDEMPWWTITRRGDAAVTWSCGLHLDEICERMQRPNERTELVVTTHQG